MDVEITGNFSITEIELSSILDNPLKLCYYSQSHIEELTKSILQDGLIEPVVLHQSDKNGPLTILNGHYRVRAVRRLKWEKVACRIILTDDIAATKYFCTTLFVKAGITAFEEGHVIIQLLSQGYNHKSVGALCGKSSSWVLRRVNLVKKLDNSIKDKLVCGRILPRIAQEITRLPQGNEQERVFKIVDKNKLTKDETAILVDEWIKADESRRCEIEAGFFKDSDKDTKMFVVLPENTLKRSVQQCEKSVLNILNYACQLKFLHNIWPWEEYYKLCVSMKKLLEITPDEKG